MTVFLPRGRDVVSLSWQRLPQEWIGLWLTLAAWLAGIYLAYRPVSVADRRQADA